jgi:hypothetical protein
VRKNTNVLLLLQKHECSSREAERVVAGSDYDKVEQQQHDKVWV